MASNPTSSKPLKLSFDAVCLAAAIDEMQPWVGGRLQRIIPVGQDVFGFGIYRGSEAWLTISLDPKRPRAHLAARRPSNDGELTDFVKSVRRILNESEVVFIRQRGLDRILEMGLETTEGPMQLVAELLGRHSFLILVDREAKVVAANRYVGAGHSSRPLLPGKPYLPPPFEPRVPLTEAGVDDDWSEFEGCSPSLLKATSSLISRDEALSRIQTRRWDPVFVPMVGPYPLPLRGGLPRPSFGAAVEAWSADQEQQDQLHQERTSLQRQLERVLLARETAQHGLQQAAEAGNRAGDHQLEAELILAYQGMIQPGDEVLSAWDYEGNPRTIILDPELSAVENAQHIFSKARKAKDRLDEVTEQEARISRDVEDLRNALAALASTEDLEEVIALREDAGKRRWLQRSGAALAKEDRPFDGHSIRELLSPGGWRVLYGLNATSNDYLTNRIARSNDWWLHVRGVPSAHVVIQTNNHPERVQKQDLQFAAAVSIRNSPTKHSTYVSVDYTLKKHVRKPRKSAPGMAVYTMEKTLHLEPEDWK